MLLTIISIRVYRRFLYSVSLGDFVSFSVEIRLVMSQLTPQSLQTRLLRSTQCFNPIFYCKPAGISRSKMHMLQVFVGTGFRLAGAVNFRPDEYILENRLKLVLSNRKFSRNGGRQ